MKGHFDGLQGKQLTMTQCLKQWITQDGNYCLIMTYESNHCQIRQQLRPTWTDSVGGDIAGQERPCGKGEVQNNVVHYQCSMWCSLNAMTEHYEIRILPGRRQGSFSVTLPSSFSLPGRYQCCKTSLASLPIHLLPTFKPDLSVWEITGCSSPQSASKGALVITNILSAGAPCGPKTTRQSWVI